MTFSHLSVDFVTWEAQILYDIMNVQVYHKFESGILKAELRVNKRGWRTGLDYTTSEL